MYAADKAAPVQADIPNKPCPDHYPKHIYTTHKCPQTSKSTLVKLDGTGPRRTHRREKDYTKSYVPKRLGSGIVELSQSTE